MGMALEKIESTNGPSHILIATLGERIVGAIVIQRFPETVTSGPDWWISEIRVRVRYQGAGIARGLIIKALFKARQSGAKGLGGDVSAQNTKSVAMCENLHGRQMKPQDYSRIFAVTSHYEPDQHIIFNRPIEELLQELRLEGVLDRYRGTGCLDQS
jgi:GNAT superfamily N-acetyltransferase